MKQILKEWKRFLNEEEEEDDYLETEKHYIKSFEVDEIIAYHCGRDIGESGQFSLKFIGTGEGYRHPPLGPGIYFATKERIAKLYCKYVNKPYFYKVRIPTGNLYSMAWGTPEDARERYRNVLEKYTVRDWKGGRRAPDDVNELVKAVGNKRAMEELIDAGIYGCWVNLPSNGQEIAIYNTDIIQILEKTPMFGKEEE